VSLFSRESLLLVLGHESIGLHAFDRASKTWQMTAAQPGGLVDPAQATPALAVASLQHTIADLLREHASSPADLRTVVRDECARYFVVEPPGNARKMSDLQLAARLRFEGLYGDPPADWAVNADWHATRPFLASAIPAPVIAAVANAARACRLRNAGVTTEFTSSWNAQRRRMPERRAWVVHLGRQTDVIAACAGGSVAAVSMVSRTRPVAAADMVDVIARCALRWNRPVPHTVYLLGAGAADQPVRKVGATSLVPMPPAANEMLAGAAA
jgi:hypothetical protein